jgi:hypothetical protein
MRKKIRPANNKNYKMQSPVTPIKFTGVHTNAHTAEEVINIFMNDFK